MEDPALKEAAAREPRVKEVLDISLKLEGVCRNAGMHAAGVVISSVPLRELVPLYVTNKQEIVTQYDMVGLEKLGLLKMDFLGLTTLTIIEQALKLIEKYRGEKIVIEDLPLDDKQTYEDLQTGFTSGVFQFESSGMQDILRRYQPNRIEDLCALNALYRPGPIQGGMIPDFIDRKHGRKPIVYDLPELEEILAETYGVILYQEQVMQISNKLAGYSLGDADILRRAMGKKKPDEMAQAARTFRQGATERGLPPKEDRQDLRPDGAVRRLWIQQIAFGGLRLSGICDGISESALFGRVHVGLADFGSRQHGQDREIHQRVPRDGHSRPSAGRESERFEFYAGGRAIRFGLGAVKNVGQGAVEAIVSAREDGGVFSSVYNFCDRVNIGNVNRRVMESLVKAGALDSTGANRAQLSEALDRAIETGMRVLARPRDGTTRSFWRVRRHAQRRISAGETAGLDDGAETRRGEGRIGNLRLGASARPVQGQGRGSGDALHRPAGGS